jgi:glycosyltransferase involved in cell wall biosynthesis
VIVHSERIRVLHVVEAIDMGVKRHVLSILASGDRQRFDMSVAAPTSRPETGEGATFVADVAACGVVLHPLDMRRAVSPIHDVVALIKLAALIRRGRYDVVHAHSSKAGFLARIAGWVARTPVIYTPNALYFLRLPRGLRRLFYVWVERLARPFTTRFVAVSESERRIALAEKLVRAARIVVIPNGVGAAALERIPGARERVRAELGLPEDALVVGAAARLTDQKDPQCLVEAMRYVVGRSTRPVYLVWAGDGELLDDVRALAAKIGVGDRCRFLGFRRDVRSVMCSFDVVALTSHYEGLPYVILEAMALGLPVVATDVVGTRDVVHDGVNGFLVPPKSPTAVASALLRLLEDSGLRERQGHQGRRLVAEQYSLAAMMERLEALYAELAGHVSSALQHASAEYATVSASTIAETRDS